MPTNQQNRQTGTQSGNRPNQGDTMRRDDTTRDRKTMSGDTGTQHGKTGQGRERDDDNRGSGKR